MPKKIGLFTTANIVAILRAVPETNGTYEEVAEQAMSYGSNVSPNTLARWVVTGNKDAKAGHGNTAYARFARQYHAAVKEHCGPDINRNRELDRALNIIDATCECGNLKEVYPDGRKSEMCRQCRELHEEKPRNGRRNCCTYCGGQTEKRKDGRVCLHCGRNAATARIA